VSGDPARAELDAEILRWMREPAWQDSDARFAELARALFRFQFEHCESYGRFCAGRGVTPDSLPSWRAIPAVPTGAFKELALHSFPAERSVHRFETSGTSLSARGTLHLDTLDLYEASLLPTFRRHVFPDLPEAERASVRVLAPSAAEAPHSSLSHMFAVVLRELATPDSDFVVRDGALEVERLLLDLERAAASQTPLTLCGTAFSFVHLLDALEQRGARIPLPEGSRVMETGGFKGRSRELGRGELYASIEAALGIPAQRIVNQYGMTELGSQFYDSVLRFPGEPRRKLCPPWARVVLRDPVTGDTSGADAAGSITVFDLANTGSVFALQTADLGRPAADGFEVLGRASGAEARGCSIAIDELLSRAAP